MYHRKHCRSRSTHDTLQVSHSTAPQSARLGRQSHSHVCSTYSGSYPQVGAPSAAMAQLYTTAGPSGSQRSAYREKEHHFTSRTPGYGARDSGSTDPLRSSSSPERHIPREFGIKYQITDPSSSAHCSHPNNVEYPVGSRQDCRHLGGESRPSSRHFDSKASTASENHGILEPVDYIRAWQDTLRPATSQNVSLANRVMPTGAPALATGLSKTPTTSNPVSAPAPKQSNSNGKTHNRPTSRHAVRPSNRVTSNPAPPSRNSSWLTWFGFGKKPAEPPQPTLRGRTLVHRKIVTDPHPSSTVIPPPMLATSSGAVPASGRAPVPLGPARQPQPLRPHHASVATQPLVSRSKITVDVAVQTADQSDAIEPCPDPPSPVPSLSWLFEDDANDEGSPSENQAVSVVPESDPLEQHLLQRPPSPSTNIHSLFPPLPPHIPPPETQVNAVLGVVKSAYAAHPEVMCSGINLLVPPAFRHSCPEYYLFDGLQHFNASYMRLMTGFYKLNVFYEEINRKPDNMNPAPEFIPIPSVQIPQASCAHRFALGAMLSHVVKLKWILHILYGTTVGMTGFLRADDTRPISPEESRSYVEMRDDIRRFTDRARGSYIPPDGIRPKDELDLEEVRKLVEMLILAGGKMFTKEMSKPIAPPTLPPFLLANPHTAVAAPTPTLAAVDEATTSSQAEVQLAAPEETSITTLPVASPSPSTPQVPPPAYEESSGVALGSPSSGSTESSATLNLPEGFVPTSHPQGGVQWSDSRKREDVLWSTDSTIAKEMRSQFVEKIASEYPILSALLAMAGDNLDTRTALAVIVQKSLGEYALKERKDATSRDELWNLISGPEAFMGMAEVVREVAVQLSRQHGDPAGLDGYIMKELVEALVKKRSIKPEFVQAFSALREVIPQPSKSVPPPSPMRVNADSKGKRKWMDDEQDTKGPESPGKRRKLDEDAKKMPPPPTSVPSSAHVSASAVSSSETYTVGGATITKARASSASATTFGGTPPASGSQFASLPRPSAQSTPSVEQNYLRGNQRTPQNGFPPFRQPPKRSSGFGGKLNQSTKFASPGVRILPPLPDHFGHSGPTTSSSSQSTSTSTLDSSVSSVKAESNTSSQTTEPQGPVWAQPVHTIKRAASTNKSASTLTRSSSSSVLSSSASSSSSAHVGSGSYASSSSSSHVTASSWSTLASQSTVHETSERSLWGNASSSVSDSDVRFARQSSQPVVSGRERDMQTVSGTLSQAVSSSSAGTRGYSAAMHPGWDVEMNDDEFEEIDVFATD